MSRPRLGEMLISKGLCDREALREAWEQKILFGDRLGTNLLTQGLIREKDLARVLGEQHGVHSGHGGVIHVDPRALELVPKELARRRSVVPHHISERALYVLMMDPNDATVLEELRFASGNLRIKPVIVCEARMWQLLAEHYGVRRGMRPIDLDNKRVRKPGKKHEAEKKSIASGDELTNEEDFNRLYASIHAGTGARREIPGDDGAQPLAVEPAAQVPAAQVPAAQVPAAQVPAAQSARAPSGAVPFPTAAPLQQAPTVFARRAPTGTVPSPTAPVTTSPAPRPKRAQSDVIAFPQAPVYDPSKHLPLPRRRGVSETPSVDSSEGAPIIDRPANAGPLNVGAGSNRNSWRDEIEHTHPSRAMPLTAEEQALIRAVPIPGAPAVEETLDLTEEVRELVDDLPVTFAEVTALLQSVKDREGIAHVVLRYARSVFKRACLLTVHPYHLVGWVGIGEGLETDRLRDFALERAEPSVFSFVTSSRAHYIGPLQKQSGNGAWVKATGRQIPRSVAVFPILVNGRAVNLLYGDRGHGEHVDGDVGELLILAQQIARTYETLLHGL